MKNKYSIFSLIKNAFSYHENWQKAWKDPTPKKKYGLSNYQKADIYKKFDYAVLINRALNPGNFNEEMFIATTCFEKLKNHKTILNINKNSLILSKIIEY